MGQSLVVARTSFRDLGGLAFGLYTAAFPFLETTGSSATIFPTVVQGNKSEGRLAPFVLVLSVDSLSHEAFLEYVPIIASPPTSVCYVHRITPTVPSA